jgi:hypothetical protein
MGLHRRKPSSKFIDGFTARANRKRISATSRHRQRRSGLEVAPRGKTLADGDECFDQRGDE